MTQQPYQQPYPQQGPPAGQYPPYPQQGPPQGQYPQYPDPGYQQQQLPQGAPTPFNRPAPSGPPAAGGQPWGNPDAPQGGGGEAPQLHQLEGRLAFFKPTSSNPASPVNAKYAKVPGETEHLVLSEVLVLDGPPIAGNLDGNTQVLTPFSGGPRQVPAYFKQIYIRGAVMPGQLARTAGTGGLVLGRIVRGTPGQKGKPPLMLADPTPEDDAIAQQVFPMWDQLVQQASGQMAPPAYGTPPVQGQQYPQQQQQAAPQGPPPGAYGQYPQQPAPQGPPPGQYPQYPQYPQQDYAPQQPAPQAWPQQGYPGPTH